MSKTLAALDSLARERNVFTASEFRRHYGGSPTSAANALTRAIRDGFVERVAHGRYAIREMGRLSTRSSTEDLLLALSPLLKNRKHRVAYLSALESHGLLLYPQSEVQVALASPTRTKQVSGRVLRQVIEVSRYLDIGASDAAHDCRVSDLPRTLLDTARRPDLVGGVDTIVSALHLAGPIEGDALGDYADRLDAGAAMRRLGALARAASRDELAGAIRAQTSIVATTIPVDPSSPSDHVAWVDPDWNVSWDSISVDVIGMRVDS